MQRKISFFAKSVTRRQLALHFGDIVFNSVVYATTNTAMDFYYLRCGIFLAI